MKCSDCPLKQYHRGHGESWDYCAHPKHNQGYYESIVGKGEAPSWCPLIKEHQVQEEMLAKLHWLCSCSDGEMQDGDRAREIAREIIDLIEGSEV